MEAVKKMKKMLGLFLRKKCKISMIVKLFEGQIQYQRYRVQPPNVSTIPLFHVCFIPRSGVSDHCSIADPGGNVRVTEIRQEESQFHAPYVAAPKLKRDTDLT